MGEAAAGGGAVGSALGSASDFSHSPPALDLAGGVAYASTATTAAHYWRGGDSAAAAAAAAAAAYDGAGAMCYTVAIILLFGLGIMLLIGTQVCSQHQENSIGKYMKEIEIVRENISRAGGSCVAAAAAAVAAGRAGTLPRATSSLLDQSFLA